MKTSSPRRVVIALIAGCFLGAGTMASCADSSTGSSVPASITITDFGVTTERTAWETWDFRGGAKYLKVDPSRGFKVTFVGYSNDYPKNLEEYDLALVGKDGKHYVFRAEYTD